MSIEKRIAALRKKHIETDVSVKLMEMQPGHCSTRLRALKKLKLEYKEEYERLENPHHATAPKAKKKKGSKTKTSPTSTQSAKEMSRPIFPPTRPSDESGEDFEEAA